MKTIPLPLLGIDMLAEETELRAGTARALVNVDLGATVIRRRPGYRLVKAGHGFTGIREWHGRALVGQGADLCDLDLATMAMTTLCSMGRAAPLDFCEYNAHLYVTNGSAMWRLPAVGQPKPVGVRMPSLPDLQAHPYGALTPGRYGAAISMVDAAGEESGARLLGTVLLAAGLKLVNLPVAMGHRWRVYLTPPDGDVLYQAEEFPALLAEHVLTAYPDGQPCQTLNLQPLPPGEFIRGHAGRMYSARGDVLWFSEAMRPHLYQPATNFIRFHGRIRFVEVLEGGAFVGDDAGTWWLGGSDPTAWSLANVSKALAVRASSLTLPAAHFTDGAKGNVAVWLAADGYWLGGADGSARQLQPGRIVLDPGTEGRSVCILRDGIRQVITLTATTQAAVFGMAIDSTTQP